MARFIGMDEAGLGPNLGPLVVAVTVWEVPPPARKFDFWRTFKRVLTREPEPDDTRLHVADSKEVFQPHRGCRALERGVLSALRMLGHEPRSYAELLELLVDSESSLHPTEHHAPWYHEDPCELPLEPHDFTVADSWNRVCEKSEVRLMAIKAAIIEPGPFNQMIREYDNKSLLVSRVAFRLLKSVWNPDETDTFVVGDKHGGRNRYDELLAEILDDEIIYRMEESAERSDYRVGNTQLRFQPRAEEYGPVALASMVAKFVREIAMTHFNRFWVKRIDGLKPTQGYPVDASRFREQIAAMQRELGIEDDVLWRCR